MFVKGNSTTGISKDPALLVVSFLWLFFSICFSGDFSEFKLLLTFLFVLLAFQKAIFYRCSFRMEPLLALILVLFIFCIQYLHGLISGFSFSFNLAMYFLATPILCLLLVLPFGERDFKYVNSALIFSAITIVTINIYYSGYRVGLYVMPSDWVNMAAFGGVKITDQQLELRTASQASLMFLAPYLTSLLVLGAGTRAWERVGLFLLIFLCLLVVIISGRRALQIVFFIGFIIAFFQYIAYRGLGKRQILALTKSITLLFVFFLVTIHLIGLVTGLENPFGTFINTVLLAFDSSQGGGIKRSIQSQYLLEFLADSPLVGHGLNSHPSYIRNIDEPWSYEWVYLALLSQIGVALFSVFTAIVIALLYRMHVNARSSSGFERLFYASVLNGSVCFLAAGSSNPLVYFSWFWFIALLAIRSR